jgi:membrane-associated phospholipid phosphatase
MTLWQINAWQNALLGTPLTNVRRIATIKRPTPNIFAAQLDLVRAYADLREDRAAEILAQLTPPTAFWSSIVPLHPDRTKWTLELIDVALRFANWVEMRFKHALACRRPYELSPQIQPLILTPGHSTLPSGHATEAFMIAYLLWRLLHAADNTTNHSYVEQLMRQASRVAINRTIAGVHFPVDSSAGQFLGLTLGQYLFERCQPGNVANVRAWRFDGARYPLLQDFDWRDQYDVVPVNGHTPAAPFAQIGPGWQLIRRTRVLQWLWQQALGEWA